jgi:hypothetical protein
VSTFFTAFVWGGGTCRDAVRSRRASVSWGMRRCTWKSASGWPLRRRASASAIEMGGTRPTDSLHCVRLSAFRVRTPPRGRVSCSCALAHRMSCRQGGSREAAQEGERAAVRLLVALDANMDPRAATPRTPSPQGQPPEYPLTPLAHT